MTAYQRKLQALEQEHVRVQMRAWPHLLVHWRMFTCALRYRDWREVLGQVPRLLLAMPGSWSGKAPKGNVGTTRMGIFEVP